jgi:DNA polymerase/3'-5' exonuclease PolX
MIYKNNQQIIDQFKLLKKQIQLDIDFSTNDKLKMKNMFRLKSILKVIKEIENYKNEIKSSIQLKHIKGIGANSIKRIDEILKTKKLSEIKINADDNNYLKFISGLEEVFGIGRKKAYDLFKNHNIKSIEDLKEKIKNKELQLPQNIIKGLKYVDKIKLNIPRKDIDHLNSILIDTTIEISPKLFGITCGSYRRKNEISNDIDFIIVHGDLKTQKDIDNYSKNYLQIFILKLKNKNIIIDSLTGDNVKTKYMGICKLKGVFRRIDIRFMPYDSYYSAILYFTGSKDTNTKMRHVALMMNYTLNEYGLYDQNNNIIKVQSEKQIFDLLGMEYLSPDKR